MDATVRRPSLGQGEVSGLGASRVGTAREKAATQSVGADTQRSIVQRWGGSVIRPAPMGVARVLVVDGDTGSRDLLSRALRDAGFLVECVGTARDALATFDAVRPAVVLVEFGLPDASGLDVCATLRERGRGRVPIIMIGSHDSELDAVVGLELGADDYVTKPLRLRAVVARIRARLRWAGVGEDGGPSAEILEVGDVRMDPHRHEVTVRGRPVALPLKEFGILETLLANAGQVVTRT